MKRLITTFTLVLCVSCPAFGRPHPIRWFKHHKMAVITSAIMYAANAADVISTIKLQERCKTCAEQAWFFGKRPSPAKLWGISSAEFALFDIFNLALLTPSPDAPAGDDTNTGAALIIDGMFTGGHIYGAYHNAGLPSTPMSVAGGGGLACLARSCATAHLPITFLPSYLKNIGKAPTH